MKAYTLIACFLAFHPTVSGQETKSDSQEVARVADQSAAKSPVKIELAEGRVVLEAPKTWKQVQPRFPNMVQYEFNAPADAKAGEAPVRITIMASGGGLQGNLERWYGQFAQPDGKATKDIAKVEQLEVEGPKVHLVTITGTYSGGSMAPGRAAPPKENHQLISGIIDIKDKGMYFITAVGPIDECEKLADDFREMLKNLKSK